MTGVLLCASGKRISLPGAVACCLQELLHLKQQLGEVQVQLQAAQQDLLRDEDIFAERVMEIARLRDQMAAMAAEAEQDRKMAAHHIQCLQAELQRWVLLI